MNRPIKKMSCCCQPCEGGLQRLEKEEVRERLRKLSGWQANGNNIVKVFQFKDYDETVSFVNSVVRIAREADHHPEIKFGYKRCEVSYSTHALGGLSENDFICAAKIEQLLA
ncbi:MAG: 4a-hydroxytetrahydrobiopterin dehydratase [Candidatus Omnitrophica bacterium]|nr:4a-hydroxytetrahydrobiopterin dehydratase [Candidatus Omnitrophota bacterium]